MPTPQSLTEYTDLFPRSGDINSQIKYVFSSAIRAPSTHNSQPWQFSFDGATAKVYRDSKIKLPNSDPKNRYAHVSVGFLLHHIATLAAYSGMRANFTFPFEGDLITEITFEPSNGFDTSHESIASALFKRRNRRGGFLPEAIPSDVLALATSASPVTPLGLPKTETRAVTVPEQRIALGEATAKNMRRVYAVPAFRREMSKWITPTGSPRRTGLPGYTLNQPVLMSWILPTMIRTFNMGPVLAKLNFGALASSAAVFGFGNEETPAGWVSTGFQASHAALTLISQSIDYSVFVASIEFDDTRTEATKIFGFMQPLQFLFAAGKLPGSVDWKTPRIPIEEKLRA